MKLNLDKYVSTKLIFVTDILLSVFATFLANILVRVMFNETGLTAVRAFWMLVGSGIFYCIRPGIHDVTSENWETFLRFAP